jgi:hypothetical protein
VVRKASILVEYILFQAMKGTSVEAMKEAFLGGLVGRITHAQLTVDI